MQLAAADLVDPVCTALTLGAALDPFGPPVEIPEPPAPDMFLETDRRTAGLARTLRETLELGLRRTLELDGAPSEEELRRAVARLSTEVDAKAAELGAPLAPLTAEERDAALQDARELIREIGLERLDRSLFLGTRAGAGHEIGSFPVHPVTAHVWLLGRVFQRLSLLLLEHELFPLERMAAAWYFDAHSSRKLRANDFPRSVREQEWSLVERPGLLLREPLVDAIHDSDLGDLLPPRQYRLATALRASFSSGFRVVERNGSAAVFEDLVRNRRFEVHEHGDDDQRYQAGWIGLGRLCAFDGPLHVRSPGMVFLPEPGATEVVADVLRRGRYGMPAAIRVESLLSVLLGDRKLPRYVPPAPSRGVAGELLRMLVEVLERADLAHEVPADEAGPELVEQARRADVAETAYRRYDLDASTAGWMKALMDYRGSSGGKKGGGDGRKKAKGGRRRPR